MAQRSSERTIYSPQSRADGDYSKHPFTPDEMAEIASQDLHLQTKSSPNGDTREKLVPYIPDHLIAEAVRWFAEKKLQRIINWFGAENVVILYNLSGAAWFFNDLQAVCEENGLDIRPFSHPVRVSTSSGLQEFGEVNQNRLQWIDPAIIKNKVVISLDDIGDTGRTQKYIRHQSLADGAQRVITVNLVEKIRPDITKSDLPNYALLVSLYKYLLGRGLDSGTDNAERELSFREMRSIVELIDEVITASEDDGDDDNYPDDSNFAAA